MKVLGYHEIKADPKFLPLVYSYRDKIVNEIQEYCDDFSELVDKYLIPKANTKEREVEYLKMKGNCYRCLSQVTEGNKKKIATEKADEAYRRAAYNAEQLPAGNCTKLKLVLEYSVFCYTNLHDTIKGYKMAKDAYDSALEFIMELDEEQYKESSFTMTLLRDNLNLWNSEL